MRHLFTIIILIQLLACNAKRENAVTYVEQNKTQHSRLVLSRDSGFVIKKNGLPFLLANSLTDTTDSFWDQVEDNDTIGKYYKVSETGNYFYCSVDLTKEFSFETHLLIELSTTGEVVKSERFFHSNYSCCLDNYYEGFSKLGDYFGLITCGTGSGYCAGYLYLFKEILPQDVQHSIPQWYWSSFGEQFQRFSSTMEFKKDNLVVHYTVEDGELDEGSTQNIQETRKFDVRYLFQHNKWTTNDSAKFEGLDIGW